VVAVLKTLVDLLNKLFASLQSQVTCGGGPGGKSDPAQKTDPSQSGGGPVSPPPADPTAPSQPAGPPTPPSVPSGSMPGMPM
jgi:hypothetical protein